MRLVLDTNVVASAILWGGTPRQLLQARRENRIELCTSMPLLAELTDILGVQPAIQKMAGREMPVYNASLIDLNLIWRMMGVITMNIPARIESEALALAREERVRLALKLLESIEGRADSNPQAVERAWLNEARRRYEAFEAGNDTAIPAEQVFAEMREEDS